MYHTAYFKEKDTAEIIRFMHRHPFAFLTGSHASGRQVATQLPVLIEERADGLYLQGHIMNNADHHRAFHENDQVLAVFNSPHTYVSATWYSNPHMGSTWNYMSVHVRGTIRFLPQDGLIAIMKKLSLHFEGENSASSTVFDNLPQDYVDRMLPGIVGFEMRADEIENVFKLSQNRDEDSYRNIIRHLEQQGGDAAYIADEMKKRLDQLFSKV